MAIKAQSFILIHFPQHKKKYAYDKIDRNDAFDCRQKIHKALHYSPPPTYVKNNKSNNETNS